MKNLKKLSILAASALLAVAFLAAGCGSDSASSGSSSKNTTVTVGATPVPHGEILNEINRKEVYEDVANWISESVEC